MASVDYDDGFDLHRLCGERRFRHVAQIVVFCIQGTCRCGTEDTGRQVGQAFGMGRRMKPDSLAATEEPVLDLNP